MTTDVVNDPTALAPGSTTHATADCAQCAMAWTEAVVMARATGSVGCHASRDQTLCGGGVHSAHFLRPAVPTPFPAVYCVEEQPGLESPWVEVAVLDQAEMVQPWPNAPTEPVCVSVCWNRRTGEVAA